MNLYEKSNHTSIINLPAQQQQSLGFLQDLIKAVDRQDVFELVEIDRKVTQNQACSGITLRQASKQMGERSLVKILVTLIVRTTNYFNVSKPMTEEQTIETAYLLLDTYPAETVEDFILMFSNGKKGKYGELFNRFDGQIIFQWMSEYLDQKAEHREKAHRAIKFGSGEENFMKTTQYKAKQIEGSEVPQNTKSVIDALKKATDFQKNEFNEKDYSEFRKKYMVKKMHESKKMPNIPEK